MRCDVAAETRGGHRVSWPVAPQLGHRPARARRHFVGAHSRTQICATPEMGTSPAPTLCSRRRPPAATGASDGRQLVGSQRMAHVKASAAARKTASGSGRAQPGHTQLPTSPATWEKLWLLVLSIDGSYCKICNIWRNSVVLDVDHHAHAGSHLLELARRWGDRCRSLYRHRSTGLQLPAIAA